MQIMVRMEKASSASEVKQMTRMSSAKRVTMVTRVMKSEKAMPSRNSITF